MTRQRNHSLPQLDLIKSDIAHTVATALSPDVSWPSVEKAMTALAQLTESALRGDPHAHAQYQQLLYILALSDDTATSATRRWLSNTVFALEERSITPVELVRPLSEAEFITRLEHEVVSHSRANHPMSQFIFGGSASRAQIRAFLYRQWFRTFRLYRDAADLLVNLVDVDEAATLSRYLYGELGEEDEQRSHPRLLAKLLDAVGLQADFQGITTLPEEIAYLNNRVRSFRNPDVGWGLAVFYVTEIVVPGNHEKLYNALLQAGLSEDDAEYYKIHISLVPPRAKREWPLIARRIADPKFQISFLTSMRQHFKVEKAYYDAVWNEVKNMA